MAVKLEPKAEAMDEGNGETGLPASIEAAWGLRDRPSKGPRPGLNLPRIVDAAVRVAGAEGLAAVSMSRVADEVGVSTMALYRYVAAKGELLDLMVDTAMGPPPETATADDGWRAGLTRWAWAVLASYRRHPWVLRVPISGPPATPQQIAWMEAGLVCLRDIDLAESEKLSVILLLSGHVRNAANQDAQIADATHAAGSNPQEAMAAYRRLLTKLIDADRFPALSTVIASGALARADEPEAEFRFGLDRILDGIEVLASGSPTRP